MFVSWGGTVCSLKRKPKYSERLLTNACAVVLRQFISGFTKAKCFILMIVTATVRTVKARKKRARVWHCKQNEKKLIISLITFLLCNDNRCKIRCVIMLFNQDEYKWTFYDDHRCTLLLPYYWFATLLFQQYIRIRVKAFNVARHTYINAQTFIAVTSVII